jgi:hypothetical protein
MLQARRQATTGQAAPANARGREMTFREMTLRVFQRRTVPHVLFQPRFESWYDWHKSFGMLPERYRGMTAPQMYDDLRVSMRYAVDGYHKPNPIVRRFTAGVEVHESVGDEVKTRAYVTPYGMLEERWQQTVDQVWRKVGFAVKQPGDLKGLCWLFRNTIYTFAPDIFEEGSRYIGERGEPQFWFVQSPYQTLALEWMRLPDLIYSLADHRRLVEDAMQAIDDSYDPLAEQIIACGKVKILNFGENLHDQLLSPRYFERYLIPWYETRSGRFRRSGIFTHIHIDGYFRSLLGYLKDLPFDGLEALTPLPQGDVTLEEIKEHIGDKILLDGIPAVMFLPTFSREALMETVERIVGLFHPRLILGASDEVPQGSGEESIERIRMISHWCRAH